MRSLRSRTVESDSIEQGMDSENSTASSTKQRKLVKKSKMSSSKRKRLPGHDEIEDSKNNLSNASSDVNVITTDILYNGRRKTNRKRVSISSSSLSSEKPQSVAKKTSKSKNKSSMKSESMKWTISANDILKSNEQNSLHCKENDSSFSTSTIKKQISSKIVCEDNEPQSPEIDEPKKNIRKHDHKRTSKKQISHYLLDMDNTTNSLISTENNNQSFSSTKGKQAPVKIVCENIGLQLSEEHTLPKKKTKMHEKKKISKNNVSPSIFDVDNSTKSQNSFISNYGGRPSFLTLVTSTSKKQTPKICLNTDDELSEKENVLKKKAKKYEKNISPKTNTSHSLLNVDNSAKSVKRSSTPKAQLLGNNTYDMINCELSNSNINKSSNNVSKVMEENMEGQILCLDDISEINMDDVINISDTSNSKHGTFNISNKTTNTIFPINVENKSDTTNDKCESITGHSGEWKVQTLTEPINSSTEAGLVHESPKNNLNTTQTKNMQFAAKGELKDNIDTNVFTPAQKSKRKKWLKFAVDSDEANSLREEIRTPERKKSLPKTPIPKKSLRIIKTPVPALRLKESKSDETITSSNLSQPKSSIKRATMPNFAKIHQKAYEKMESLTEYSERKKNRASLLLSSNNNSKTSRELFKLGTPKDKFKSGFKVGNSPAKKANIDTSQKKHVTMPSKLPIRTYEAAKKIFVPIKTYEAPKKIFGVSNFSGKNEKTSVFSRSNVIAVANKTKSQNSAKVRNTNREMLKGVRVNRRFELLMQMRNNK